MNSMRAVSQSGQQQQQQGGATTGTSTAGQQAGGNGAQPQHSPQQQHGGPPPVGQDHPQTRSWETSVNIAIEEMKDFREDVAPLQELYSEFTTAEGRILFECAGLTKDTGIDLMDCPLDISLKLRVRRRMPQGGMAQVLWHVVLPMPLISKHLLGPPHEWQTWIGLLPNTVTLDAHPPDVMFTQSVHLISRPEFPKLRLRFKYYNPEHQAQIETKRVRDEQDRLRRKDALGAEGKKNFEELQSLMQSTRGVATTSIPVGVTSSGSQQVSLQVSELAACGHRTDEGKQREALHHALQYIGNIRDQLATVRLAATPDNLVPPSLSSNEVLASTTPGQLLDAHSLMLRQRLRAVVQARSSDSAGGGGRGGGAGDDELLLSEGLRSAILGIFDDGIGTASESRDVDGYNHLGLPSRTLNRKEELACLQQRYPQLWDLYREVSLLSKERSSLLTERVNLLEDNTQLESSKKQLEDDLYAIKAENSVHRRDLESTRDLQEKKEADKLLANQRRYQAIAFEKELSAMKRHLEEQNQRSDAKEAEVDRLRKELAEARRQIQGH